jgi:hypothetical protein
MSSIWAIVALYSSIIEKNFIVEEVDEYKNAIKITPKYYIPE